MKRKSIKRIITAGILAGAFALTVMCQVPARETEAAGEKVAIGEKSSDQDYEITLKNESGKDITQVALRASYGEFSDNLLAENTVFRDKEEGTLWCTPAEIVNYVPPVYDIQLTFDDDSTAVLHTLPFGDAEEISILTDEESETVYVRFFSISLNRETDSLQREQTLSEKGEDGIIADYKAKIQGNAGGSSSGSGGGSSGSGGGAPAQSAPAPAPQQCLDNGLMF